MSRRRQVQAFESLEASSDSMIDIQIEESLVRETLMTIDSANFQEDFVTFAGFFCVIILTTLTGLYGPPATTTFEKRHMIMNSRQESVHFVSTSVCPMTRHLSIGIKFEQRQDAYSENTLQIQYRVEGKYDGNQVFFAQNHFDEAKFDGTQNSPTTTTFQFFTDNSIIYNYLSLEVKVKGDLSKYSTMIISGVAGVPDHTLFLVYFRSLFSAFAIVFFALFLVRLRSVPVTLWHLEQRLTVPLLALACIFCNPFFALDVYWPSPTFQMYDIVFGALFKSYLSFFVLTLFDSLRYKNRRTDKCFFVPKAIFTVIIFWSLVSHGLNDTHGLTFMEVVLAIIYGFWLVSSVVLASVGVDITERYKFHMYLTAVGSFLAILTLAYLFFVQWGICPNRDMHFIVTFAVANMFVLLMGCCHWPYEVLHDQGFADSAGGSDRRNRNEIFANVESDT